MKRQIAAWSVAFALFATGAAAMLVDTVKQPRPPAPPVGARDAAKLPPVELQLIASKIREGDLQALKGDLEAARATWKQARAMGEGLWPAHEGIADSCARHKLYADAEAEYAIAESLSAGRERDFIRVKRARNLRAKGDEREALDILIDLSLPAMGPEIVNLVGQSKHRSVLAAVVRNGAERDPWLWEPVSQIEEKAGNKAEAARAFGRCAALAVPWDAGVVNRAIQMLRAEKLTDDALEVCRAYAKASPQDASIYTTIGDLLSEAGRPEEALLAYTSIVDLRPGDAGAHVSLARILRKMGRADDARAQVESAVKLQSDVPMEPELMALLRFDLRITMTWDTATDVDLHVTDPRGEKVFYKNMRSTAGAIYHVDNRTGYGPETCTLLHAAPGAYRVVANYYGGGPKTQVKMVIVLYEGTAKEQRFEHSLTLERRGQDVAVPPVVVPE